MAASFSEISGEEIQKLKEKAVNKNTVKTTKMKVLKSWTDIVTHEAKELDESSSRFFLPRFAKAMMAPIVSRTV